MLVEMAILKKIPVNTWKDEWSLSDNREKNYRQKKQLPTIEFADAVNRSMVGDLGALAKGGCSSIIGTVILGIVVIFLLSKCST